MPVDVVCPSCWSWAPLGKRTTCKRCGVSLMFPDGRRLDEPEGGAPPPPEAEIEAAVQERY